MVHGGGIVNAGSHINTHGNEYAPTFDKSGKMYFSSDGQPGLGKYDIFVLVQKNGKVQAENLGLPFNSVSDDFDIHWKNSSTAYFTSDREGGKGGDDIYEVNALPKSAKYAQKLQVFWIDKVTGKENLFSEANITVNDKDGKTIYSGKSDQNGTCFLGLNPSQKYLVKATGFKNELLEFSFNSQDSIKYSDLEVGENQFVNPNNWIVKIEKEMPIPTLVLDIYYDYNKFNIRPDAASKLDSLVLFLKRNKGRKFELSSHTDTRGSVEYNQQLSQSRAEAAVKYLISKGIDAKSLKAKGEGENKPIIPVEKNEEEYQTNRRTEIRPID